MSQIVHPDAFRVKLIEGRRHLVVLGELALWVERHPDEPMFRVIGRPHRSPRHPEFFQFLGDEQIPEQLGWETFVESHAPELMTRVPEGHVVGVEVASELGRFWKLYEGTKHVSKSLLRLGRHFKEGERVQDIDQNGDPLGAYVIRGGRVV